MALKLDNKPDQDSPYDDGNLGWYKPDADNLEDSFAAPSAGNNDLPPNHPSRGKTPEQLANAESGISGASDALDTTSAKELGLVNELAHQAGKIPSGSGNNVPGKIVGAIGGKGRWLVGGGLGGAIATFAIFSILQGPFQLIHLGQILSKFSRGTDSSISTRLKKHFIHYRGGLTTDVGQTRVGYAGNRVYKRVEAQLKNIGVEFQRDPKTGRPLSQSIDISKHPKYQGMSRTEAIRAIAEDHKIPGSAVENAGGHKFSINWRDYSDRSVRQMTFTSLEHIEDGKILNGMNKRVMSKYFNLPSLFHPLRKITSGIENKLSIRSARLARETSRQETKRAKLKTKYEEAKTSINEAVSPYRKAVNATLFVAAGLCVVKSISKAIPLVNYANVVVPAMIASTDKQALGSQTQYNDVPSLNQIGDITESLKDENGKTVWEGKVLNAMATEGPGQGEDIEDGYKQAFSINTTSSAVVSTVNGIGDNRVSGAVCSPLGFAVQGIAGLVLLAVGPGGWAAKSSQAAVSTVAISAAIHFIEKGAIDHLTQDPVKYFSGPQGGNLLAYGARASSNLNAISMGGVELSKADSLAINKELNEQDLSDFQEKSFFTRTFDPNDYRSLTAKAMRMPSKNPINNISDLAVSILNPLKLVSNLFSVWTPKVKATEQPYDWGFPEYGIPRQILNNTKYEDPYDNANTVAPLFEKHQYIDRAKNCFGVDISRGPEGWDAVKTEEINPVDDNYINAKCNDFSDENWARTTIFVFDSSISTLTDCYAGNGQACSSIGFNGKETANYE